MAALLRLRIDEEVADEGQLLGLTLVREGDEFKLLRGDQPLGSLSARIIIEVISRYGRPLEMAPAGASDPLALTERARLRSWRYRAPVDLEAKLYLLLDLDGHEPTAVLARQVVNALRFLLGER